MTSEKYPLLFSPLKVGTQEVRNRVFMPPVSTNLADHGYVTDALIDHYTARAAGGVGLIVTEVVTVEPTYVYLPGDMCVADDSYVEGWTRLAASVHEHGAKILPQLFHPAYMAFPIPGTPQLIAPSNVGPYYAREAPRPVTREELAVLVRQFGDAAERMKRAGTDGVEIHAAHAHGLLGGFLSPLYNKRTDEYGGDIDGRLRLTLEVVREVRERCGEDFIIDVRISGDEYSDGGLTITDMCHVARELERAGVDLLHVSGGTTIKRGSAIPAAGTRQGSHADVARQIKRCVSIPVATVGRINEAWIAEELLEEGVADACMMGRANLCDAEFCNKAAAGVELRLGVRLTAADVARDYAGYEVVLATGAEPIVPAWAGAFKQAVTADDILAGRAFPGKKIVVVGGGSVGCEVADYLAPLVNDLAKGNRDITLVEMGPTLDPTEGAAGRAALVTRMLEKGVHVLTEARVTGVTQDSISYEKDGGEHVIEGVDTMVLALGYRPDQTLAESLAAAGARVHVIGDAEKPGNIKDAMAAAYALAREL